MIFYANLYPVTIFYTNLPKTMLSLKFYAFISMVSRSVCVCVLNYFTSILFLVYKYTYICT